MGDNNNKLGFVGEKVKLKEVCHILNGYAFRSEKYVDEGIRVIRISNVQKGYIEDEKPQFYPEDEGENIKDYLLQENDLLLSLTGNVGRVALLKKKYLPAALNQRVACLRENASAIRKKYLYYILLTNRFENECIASAKGIAQKNMSTEWLKDYSILLRPFVEQDWIIMIFDKLSLLIRDRSQQLEWLDTLIKARFVEMFGDCKINPKRWNTRKLGEIADVGSSKRVFVKELQESGIPFYRGTEVGSLAEGKTIQPELFITAEHYKELCEATGAPKVGDLLMPSICPDGRIWVVNTKEPFYFKDGRVLWVHNVNSDYNPIFLLYTLKDRIMTDYLSIASGTTFAELKIFALKDCQVFDVPKSIQNEFATFVAQVDKSKFDEFHIHK